MSSPFTRVTRNLSHSGRSSLHLLMVGLAVLPAIASAAAPDASAGKAISGSCATCHGDNGFASNTGYPNLAGQNYRYLVDAMKKYKKGQRGHGIMYGQAHGLSMEQIKDLSAYYANMKIQNCSAAQNKTAGNSQQSGNSEQSGNSKSSGNAKKSGSQKGSQ